MALYQRQYSGGVTVAKAVVGALGAGSVGILLNWLIDAFQTGDFTLSAEQSAAMTAVAAAIYIAVKNFAKVKLGWNWLPILLCVAVAFGGQGCNTLAPAVGGKTKIETTFSDVVGVDGVQNTNYSQKLEAPVGVEAKDLASMTYDWKGDGSGAIAVSSDRDANTTMQADLLKAAFDANTAQTNLMLQALLGLGGLASPLIAQKIDVDAVQSATDAANKAALQKMIADLVKQAIEQQAASVKPAPGPVTNPLADVPVPVLVPDEGQPPRLPVLSTP